MKNSELIKKFTFFSGLQEDDLEKIASISKETAYRKNALIFSEGQRGEAFYFIISGRIKIYRINEDGKEHILHILGEGNVFGEATLFGTHPYPASAAVHEDAVVGMIRNSELENLITSNSELALKLIKLLADKLLSAQRKIRELAFNDVFARTASQLLKLANEFGVPIHKGIMINIPLSRQELADMVGTARETISRTMSSFKKERAIAEIQDRIVILDKEKLRQWL